MTKSKLPIVILILLLAFTAELFSMNIRGIVMGTDENGNNTPLPNTNIQIAGTNRGALANRNGEFDLVLAESDQLIFSYVGYKSDTLEITPNQSYYEVILRPELSSQTILVHGDKPESLIDHSSMAKTEIITSKGLTKAACCNLSESFQTNASVDVSFSDAVTNAKQIQLLGLAQVYTQMMTEKIPNLQGLAANYGLSFVPGPWMNAISISKGASSVATGYESITGQINVEYKQPEQAERFYLNLYSSDIARFEGSLITKQELSESFDAVYFLHGNYYNNKLDMNKDGFADMPLSSQANALVKLNYEGVNYESKTILQAMINDFSTGQMDFLTDIPNPSLWGSETNMQRYNFYTKNGFVFPSEHFQSLGTIVSFTHHRQDSYFGKQSFDAEQNSLYLNLIWQSEFELQSHNNSESDEHNHLEDDNHSESHADASHSYFAGVSFSYNNYLQYLNGINLSQYEVVPGAFIDYTYKGINNLSINPGIRFDYHNVYGNLITPRLMLKYQLDDNKVIRASAGKGFHNSLPIAENQNILSTSRDVIIQDNLPIEEAWNYGLSSTIDFKLGDIINSLNLEYFYTDFTNQTIIDLETLTDRITIYNTNETSYSHNFQIDLKTEPFDDLILIAAYRFNDVRQTIDNVLRPKPFISSDKMFGNLSYTIDSWSFDFTLEYNGGGRLPNTSNYPAEYQIPSNFDAFFILYGQVTKKFEHFEVYLGSENINNFVQAYPIISARDPFSEYFNSSYIWGPIHGRKIYLGIRLIYI